MSPRLAAQRFESSPRQTRFYADDPLWCGDDMRSIPKVADFDLSKSYEFVNETFGQTVRSFGSALNVNTLDEVPDSSWLRDVPRNSDGQIRGLASRYVPGEVVGQFRYTGTRSDDPNDIYPHERRRELRGMRVFAAWLNHDDARSLNSIDTYVEENGRRYIRHYLQDFGSNLGSGSTSAQQPRGGNEYLIDRGRLFKGLLTFGLWTRDWTRVRYPDIPSLGNIEADFFEPAKWKTEYPQPAFDQMDDADAFWAARIASRFTNPMIRAIVETGRLSDPLAARLLTDIIIRRRDKVVAYWISRTNPLDSFSVQQTATGSELTFDNAAVRLGLTPAAGSYRIEWLSLDNRTGALRSVRGASETHDARLQIPAGAWGPPDEGRCRYAVARIATLHPAFPSWSRPVTVTVRDRNGRVEVVGIDRPTGRDDGDGSRVEGGQVAG